MLNGRRALHRIGDAAARFGSDTTRHPRLWRSARVGLTLLVVALLVVSVATQWDELREHDLAIDLLWLVPAVIVLVFVHVLAALAWDLTLRALGHRLDERRAQAIWAKSLLARYVPGTVLMVASRVVLSEGEGVPRRATVASLAYEQSLMLLSALIVSGSIFLAEATDTIPAVAMFAASALLLGLIHPKVFQPLADRILEVFGRDPLPAVLSIRTAVSLLGLYLVIWVLFGVGGLLAAKTAFELGASDLAGISAAQALGYTAALLLVVFPGGLGVRDGAFALVLDRFLPGGFAFAAAVAIVVRLVTTLAEVIYAAGAVVVGRQGRSESVQSLREAMQR